LDTGTKISGLAHIGLIGVALFGGVFNGDPLPPFEVREVSVISARDFAALSVSRTPPVVAEQPAALPLPDPATDTPDVRAPSDRDPAQVLPEPATVPAPDVVPDARADLPATAADVTDSAPVLEVPQSEVVVLQPPAPRPVPRASERVAPQPVAPPPPDARPDEVISPEVTPDKGAEKPQEPQEKTAPEEAADRIVTEADAPAASAPTRSPRPPARPAPRSAARSASEPAQKPDPKPVSDSAVQMALAEALDSTGQAAPSGPPLSAGEKDALRVAVQRCWNVGSLSSEALSTTVVVAVRMRKDARPETGSIRMLSSSGGTAESARRAYEAARRAIIRCGASGYKLPKEKYSQWRDIEMTFNPEKMRIK
jgi:hypothetical protein